MTFRTAGRPNRYHTGPGLSYISRVRKTPTWEVGFGLEESRYLVSD